MPDMTTELGAALKRIRAAEHPADDEEPVKEEWLRDSGFIREDSDPECERETNWLWFGGGESLGVCWGTELHAWMVWHGDDSGPRIMPSALWPKTRGDVRRLCKSLGIELKEGSVPK
jgi:hypothetical protein